MSKMNVIKLLALTGLCASCGAPDAPFDAERYESDLLEWRAERLENLRGPTGYLNLAGLFWLDDGVTSIGSGANNEIVFPATAAEHIGELQVSADGVELQVVDGVAVVSEGKPVTSLLLADDTTDAPVTVSHESLAWTIIKRDERFALRLRDFENPAIAAFPPIDYFPIDLNMRVAATFKAYETPKTVAVATVIEGLGWNPESPGVVEFELQGESMQLEAYASGDSLFFVFGDRSSGRETYPAGRFLYADAVDHGEMTWLDFNRAYNPPCAFNDFSTCPVASPQNRLPVVVAAGEKYDP
ncbi:MAG: DUF1684 domain-containing protein [Woeseiaceae bacterium]